MAGFVGSREFVIALIVSLIVAGAGSAGLVLSVTDYDLINEKQCRDRTPPGQDLRAGLDLGPWTGPHDAGVQATERVPLAGLNLTSLQLCVLVGSMTVEPTSGNEVEVRVTAAADGTRAQERVDELRLELAVGVAGDELHVSVWQVNAPAHRSLLEDEQRVEVALVVAVPDGQVPHLDLATYVADIEVSRVAAKNLTAATDVGSVDVEDVVADGDIQLVTDVGDVRVTRVSTAGRLETETDVGDVSLRQVSAARGFAAATDVGDIDGSALNSTGINQFSTDVGHVELWFDHLVTASTRVETDVGHVQVTVPGGAAYGYDVRAESDHGHITFDLGPTEFSSREPPDRTHRAEARTQGFAEATHANYIRVFTDVGNIQIETT